MTSAVHRRAFLAATTLAVPAVAFAGVAADVHDADQRVIEPMKFEDLMKQIGRHLKTMRSPMRSLDTNGAWDDMAFYSNQISILLVQSIEAAEQVHIPIQSKAQYENNEAQFVTDLCLGLAAGAIASIELSKALWRKDEQAAKQFYSQLKQIRNDGHSQFQDDD